MSNDALSASAIPLKAMKQCPWTLDDAESDVWESSCGQTWQFTEGGPSENRARFCHYCGGRIVTSRKDRRALAAEESRYD